MNVEQAMLSQEISIPVYFSSYNEKLDTIIDDISKIKFEEKDELADVKGNRESAVSELLTSISANGYQVCLKFPNVY